MDDRPKRSVSGDSRGKHRRLRALQNCVLEFQDGTFTKHSFSPKYRSRSRSEIPYDPNAECPEFKLSILPQFSPDDREAFQKYSGQCLLGRNATQTILILDGVGGAGKGAAVNIAKGVTGAQSAYELRTNLLDKQFEIGRMTNKTLLIGSDVKADFLSQDAASFLKKLTGGDLLEGERKRSNDENPLTGDFNVMITSNSRLRVRLEGDDSAWERRLIILRLETPFSGKRVEKIHEKLLQEEGSGILNWCLEGLAKLFRDMARGAGVFQLSAQQQKRVHSLLRESDSLRIFIQSSIVQTGDKDDLTSEEIIAKYFEYCGDCDWAPLSSRKAETGLRDLMMELFKQPQSGSVTRDGKGKRGYRHVRFRGDNEEDPPSIIA
jgi:putative DNA primase/helicase